MRRKTTWTALLAATAIVVAACATSGPAAVVPEFAEPVELGPDDEVEGPASLSRTAPRYPDALREAGVEGRVVFTAVIGRDGRLREVRIESSDHPLFTKAVLEAAREWRFRPATLNGEPVAVYYRSTQDFTLR